MNASDHLPSPTWREYLDARLEPLATREAVQELRAELRLEIQTARSELGEDIQQVRGDLGREIRDAKVEIIKWNLATLLAFAAFVWAMTAGLAG